MEAKLLEQRTSGGEPSKLPYNLIRQITNDLDKERILGSGGFGTVYKGVYKDGREIAVKVLHSILGVDDKEFNKEFDILRGLKHPNIVELVGFCHEWEEELVVFEGKQVTAERLLMALCFEYVQKGSLNKLISDENTGFTWHTRYKIIKGICVGLQYLHDGEHPIMHFDLKPDNILLDGSMAPKIADFGLSKLFGEENTKKTMSSAGTCGYWPPEYIKHQIISREFDIFSLGVIIVKIMNGHESYNSIVELPRRKSVKLVHESWKKRLCRTLSPSSLEVYCNQVKRCIEIALDCLISNRQERPNIQKIVSSLNETETMIGDKMMQNEQFYQDDGVSTLPSDSIIISSGPSENFPVVEPMIMPLSLLKEMTDDFSRARLLGQGFHERVFKGAHGNGQFIAVKRFLGPHKKLQNEIAVLMKLHHQNIVQFIGYCHETEKKVVEFEGKYIFSEREFTVLCFEYLPRGSLDQYIAADIDSGLDWQTRYRIIKGICEGLKYLHEGLKSPMIHMELKPSSILLDEKMIPKIDHSHARLSFSYIPTLLTIDFRPQYGEEHMPPEFIQRQIITKEFDIYSLGVIMLQLMTGEKSYHEFRMMSREESIELAHEKWRERLQKTVDVTPVEGYFQQVKKCLEIAFRCVEADRHKRPAIGDIVHTLNGAGTSLIPQLESELLLHVHPLELPFMASSLELPRKKKTIMSSSCLLQLDNKGNDRVAFMLVANNPSRYLTKEPLCGVVPPRCAYTLILRMRSKKQAPSSSSTTDRDDDYFTLYSVGLCQYDLLNVGKDTSPSEYSDFLKKAKEKVGHEVQELTLKVLCCQQQVDSLFYNKRISFLLEKIKLLDRATSSKPTPPTVEIITTTNAQQVSSIDIHPTEPWILMTHHMGSLRVWNYKTMTILKEIKDVTDEPVHVAKFIAREKWIINGNRSGHIHVCSHYKNKEVASFNAHRSCIITLVVHPTNPFVLSSSDDVDHLIKLWDWGKGWGCTEFQGHTGTVTQVTFNPNDSNTFASASLDGTIKIWSISSDDFGKIITLKLDEHGLCVDYFTRYNQQHLIVGCKDKTAQIWKLETKGRVDELEGHTDHISAISLHPEISMLITGSLDGTIRIWNSVTYKLENIIGFNLGAVYAFGCIKGSRRIVVGCHQGIAMMDISLP